MKNAFVGTLVIAHTTLLGALRSRILLVSTLFALILIALSLSAASVSISERSRLIIDIGLAASSVIGTVIGIGLVITSFASELHQRTVYTTLVRPIPRASFVLGKYFGNLFAVLLVVTLMLLATMVTVWIFGAQLPDAFFSSIPLVWMELAVVCAVAQLFSTMASPVMAATYSAGIILAGNLAGEIIAIAEKLAAKGEAQTQSQLLNTIYYILPDMQSFSLRPQAANYLAIPENFIIHAMGYGLLYLVTVLIGAVLIFERRKQI